MTIKELKENYYSRDFIRELEFDAMERFIREYCDDSRTYYSLINCLMLNNIYTIDDLRKVQMNTIKSYNRLGKTRMPYLIKIKEFLDTLEDD